MMELNLFRVDYMQAGITSPKSMKLLPSSKKEASQVALADHSGILQVFSARKGDVQSAFKTLPGTKLTRLELGGPVDKARDRIFVASGSDVRGFSKKGKQFLDFKTNLTEPIKSMYVEGTDLMLCGTYTFNHYRECKDLNYFLSSDMINDILCLPTNKMPEGICALACQDRVLKILKDSDLLYEVEASGPAQTLWLINNDGGLAGNQIVYGTSDGKVAAVQLSASSSQHCWELQNEDQRGGITSFSFYDMSNSGMDELILGRDDGYVEVYSFDECGEPLLTFKHVCSESVTSVQGGIVSTPGYSEVILSTYAGWIIGLTSEHLQKNFSVTGEVLIDDSMQNKILQLKKEIEELQRRVKTERETYQQASKADNAVSAVPIFDVNDKFTLNKEDASYTLCLELQMSIDNILLQSDVPIDLLDVEKNSAVVSFSPCKPEDGNYMLTTYRCQANTTRLELKIRSIEGQAGCLLVYITPRTHPKTCIVKQYPIKPLSLHQRIHTFDSNRPYNNLRLKGNFSLAEVHYWIATLLPEVSERPPAGDSVILYFASTFLGTQLECSYRRGEAEFRSDNVSTISILKDTITKEATKKKIHLDITYDINPDSVKHTLQLIHPMLDYQLTLAKKVQLIDGLKELQTSESGDTKFLTSDYKEILHNADHLMKEYKKQPCHLERLYGMITDLFIDKFKFKGQNVKSRVPILLEVLDSYELQKLINFVESGA